MSALLAAPAGQKPKSAVSKIGASLDIRFGVIMWLTRILLAYSGAPR